MAEKKQLSSKENSIIISRKSNNSLARDEVSGLLNYDHLQYYISAYLEHMNANDVCALFIISLEKLKSVKYILGTKTEENIIRTAAKKLSEIFRATDIIGRSGENEFIVFISGQSLNKHAILNKAEMIKQLKFAEDYFELELIPYIGIYAAYANSLSFTALYEQARSNRNKAIADDANSVLATFDFNIDPNNSNNFFVPAQESIVPINYLIQNMNDSVRILEIKKPIEQLYISPNFFKNSENSFSGNKTVDVKIHPYDLGKYELLLQKAVDSNEAEEDEYRISPDGVNWRWRRIRVVKIPYYGINSPVLLEISHDITDVKEKDMYLAESGKMLKVAFENSTKVMWEVDIKNKVYTFFNYENRFDTQTDTLNDFPESLISGGWVHPDSASRFRKFGADILNGKSEGNGNFIMRYRATDSYGWASYSYNMIFDGSGSPVKAVGSKRYLSDLSDRKTTVINYPSLPDAVYPFLIFSEKANLSENSIENPWVEGGDCTDFAEINSCSDIIQIEKEKLFSTDDNKDFSHKFSRKSMLKACGGNMAWRTMEYRRIDSSGNIRWVLNTANLIKDPVTHDVYLFNYLTDIERRHNWERGVSISKDPATGLYDKETAEQMIKNLLNTENGCAVSVIYINGFAEMKDDGYMSSNQKQRYIVSALELALGSDCVLGRYDSDMFVAAFVDIDSRFAVKKRLEDAFEFVRSLTSGTKIMSSLRFVSGVVCVQSSRDNYNNMIYRAIMICELWKNSASDIIAFPRGNENISWLDSIDQDDGEYVIPSENEIKYDLSDEEKDILLECFAAMIVFSPLSEAVKKVLKYMGNYYKADRIYVLTLAENDCVVTMMYEWIASGKFSIQRAISGLRVEKFPFLCRCMKEKKPVFMHNRNKKNVFDAKDEESSWNFIAIPILNNNNIIEKGFLCIENPKAHTERAALPSTLISYLFSMSDLKNKVENKSTVSFDKLTTLPNLRSYTEVIDSVNSDIYSSLGVLALDVPDFSAINSMQGFDYGSKLILHIAEVLTEMFGKSYLFRTWDSEFVALCPNTTMDAFVDRCARVRTVLQQCYHKQIRIGYTWSDGIFYAKKLVKEAKAIMRCEHVKETPPADSISVWGMKYTDFRNAADNGKFTVYFQPKVDMTTDTLVGAEALIRGIGDDGSIIPPGKFIDAMEQNGTIRDLDFFVLDSTFSCLEEWYSKGFDPISVSVNISRVTLLDPTAPASMLAIQSRYPDALSGLIELEITESGCDIEKATLTHVMNNFRQFGMKFGLDDFGSHYSNISIFANVKFDTIKLDRSLINELSNNEANRMLVKNIIGICKKMGMTCIAEGVETEAQVSALLSMGCSVCQGYYYDKPLPAAEFTRKWLENTMEEIK